MAIVTNTDSVTDTEHISYTQMNSSIENGSSFNSLSYILTTTEIRANTVFYAFMIPLAISGNVLSIAVSSTILRHRKSCTDLLIGFLAFSDLLNIFGIHTFSVISLIAGQWVGGMFICGVQYYMTWSCLKFSFLILVMLTVDRYIALVKPLRYRSMVTSFRIKVGIVGNAVFSFGSSLITVIGYIETIGIIEGWYICMNNWSTSSTYYIAILIIYGLTYVGGLAVFTYCNIVVAIHLCRFSNKVKLCCRKSEINIVETQSPTTMGKRQMRERKAARIILLISLLFFLFWGPYFITIIMAQIGKTVTKEVTLIALRLLFANAFINPIIYGFFNKTYRRGFMYFTKLFFYYMFCKRCRKPEDDNIFFERRSWRQEVIRGIRSKSTTKKRDSTRPVSGDSLPDVILTSSQHKTPTEDVHKLGLGNEDADYNLEIISPQRTASEQNNNKHCYDNIGCDVTDEILNENDFQFSNEVNIEEECINRESYDTRF